MFSLSGSLISTTSSSFAPLGMAGDPMETNSYIDFAGPFMGKMFLIVVDAHSKWPEVITVPSTASQHTINVLMMLSSRYCLPEQIVSDNGPQFCSEEFACFMKENGIKHIFCSPYHPSSNGLAERFVQTFKQAMKASSQEEHSLSHRLTRFLLDYRATPHRTTNVSPAEPYTMIKIRNTISLCLVN